MAIFVWHRGIHHAYYGLGLLALALYGGIKWDSPMLVWGLYGIGAILLVDDVYQHRRQVREPKYQSPVHRWTAFLYKYKFIRRLERRLNSLFGKVG